MFFNLWLPDRIFIHGLLKIKDEKINSELIPECFINKINNDVSNRLGDLLNSIFFKLNITLMIKYIIFCIN